MLSRKQGYFWELEDWMADNDVSVRELAILLSRGKTAISRLVCGQFVRVDERLQRDLARVTKEKIGPAAWAAFSQRRLDERSEEAA